MRDLSVKLEMNYPDKTPLTRRAALLDTLKATLVTSLTLPAMADASPVPPPAPEHDFAPENDYPYFGYEPPSTS